MHQKFGASFADIDGATVKRFHYDSHDELRTHLDDFIAAYTFARRLKTLNGLTPHEDIAKIWTSEPERFIVNPIHHMPGLNTYNAVITVLTERQYAYDTHSYSRRHRICRRPHRARSRRTEP
jgi:hypothetical protein